MVVAAGEDGEQDLADRLYGAWVRLGRHDLVELDHRTSSPAVIGRAILAVTARRPDWSGRLHLTIRGNPYPEELVRRALERTGVQDVVSVLGPVPHREVMASSAAADLLFLTLPTRVDGSAGGRISAKTYEYLTTDRPILAATPAGENRDYLEGRAGVWLLDPDDEQGMATVIEDLAAAKFTGAPRSFDRSTLREELSYDTRAREFDAVLRDAIAGRAAQTKPSVVPERHEIAAEVLAERHDLAGETTSQRIHHGLVGGRWRAHHDVALRGTDRAPPGPGRKHSCEPGLDDSGHGIASDRDPVEQIVGALGADRHRARVRLQRG